MAKKYQYHHARKRASSSSEAIRMALGQQYRAAAACAQHQRRVLSYHGIVIMLFM